MSDPLARQLADLPVNLANHLRITIIPLLLALAISLPLAIRLVRRPSLRYPVMTLAGVIQTVPGLALLALMVPILAAFGSFSARWLGIEVPAFGFPPAVLALTLYGILPILRNTVTGILGVDSAMTEAARGMGMTERQVLLKVELPLAAPVILAGIRTAAVWIVGTATLATPVGQRSLGNAIFAGLQTRNWIAVLVGSGAAAVLAITLDGLIGTLQRGVAERRRGLRIMAVVGLIGLFAGGLIAPRIVSFREAVSSRTGQVVADAGRFADSGSSSRPLRIGSKTFTEQYILAELIARRLRRAGFPVEKTESLGSTIGFDALTRGEIDVFVDYSGTLWANALDRSEPVEDWKVLAEVSGWLASERGVRNLGPLGFENAYALAMRRESAERLGIRSISDLVRHASDLRIGGDYEIFDRPEWRSLESRYGMRFAERVVYDPTFLYEAVARGDVDVITAFTTDGRIETFDLVILDDDRGAIPPYDALLLLSPQVANRPGVAEALEPLIGGLDAALMREANGQVDRDRDKRTVEDAAIFLDARIGRSGSPDPR